MCGRYTLAYEKLIEIEDFKFCTNLCTINKKPLQANHLQGFKYPREDSNLHVREDTCT